jgi:hypothetical protein
MLTHSLLVTYRFLAGITVLIPLVVNLTIKGGPVASFIYAPVITLLILLVAVYFDDKLVAILTRKQLQLQAKKLTRKVHHKGVMNCCILH